MLRLALLSAVALTALAPTAAHADVPHTVAPGETLWGIAMANGLPTASVAAASGLSPEARVVAGTTVMIPPAGAAPAAAPAQVAPAQTTAAAAAAAAPRPMGGYVVRPGDTLSGLAARSGVPLAQMAYVNGLATDAWLIAGTALKLPTGSPVLAQQATPAAAPAAAAPPAAAPAAAPQPAPGRLTAAQVSSIAAQHGVPGSLAAAIAWQESGFNNAMVSGASARGIMQVMPGTWDWVQRNLSATRLDPASPTDNVRAGSLYLARLLQQTGGDPALAAAGYYQGLASVRRIGMLPETRRYVANVLALRGRFGG